MNGNKLRKKIALTREMCIALNDMAKNICDVNSGK